MRTNFRQKEILDLARAAGKVVVEDLAEQFDVTVQTIRRDLSDLANQGKLERVHGGAIVPSGVVNIVYDERRDLNREAKKSIGETCAAMIPNGSSLFLNIGSTTEAVAHGLMDHEGLLVVTNNLNVANILSANPACEIVVAGGMLRRLDGGLSGGFTVEIVRQFKFDYAVIGCSAIDADGELLDFDAQEILVSQTAVSRARSVMAVTDRSKLDRKAPISICSLSDVTCLITDPGLPDAFRALCKRLDTKIIEGAVQGD